MVFRPKTVLILLVMFTLWVAACGAPLAQSSIAPEQAGERAAAIGGEHKEHNTGYEHEHLVDLTPVKLGQGEKLQVVATTNIVGDLVSNIGGERIDLTVLLAPGADPHAFEPTPQDVAAVAEANVILTNGLGLEEFLAELIENAGGSAPVIALAEGVEPRQLAGGQGHNHKDDSAEVAASEPEEEAHHSGVDPHAFMTAENAGIFVENIEQALSALDPANAETYIAHAEAYQAQLAELEAWIQTQIEAIPVENRKMVTDHEAYGYYADHYGLEIIGAVIPAYSTGASPSAQELAALQDAIAAYGVKAVFVGTTVNPAMAGQVANDTGIRLVPLYSDSLGEAGSGAETYLDYMRYNTNAIVEALQ